MTIERHFVADGMRGSAVFSDDEKYRYDLRRTWDSHQTARTIAFLMLNPSKATEEVLDPTITRCIGFAKAWGYGSLVVRNCFALRSTDPKGLKFDTDPVGPENDEYIDRLVRHDAVTVIAAWGVNAKLYGRDKAVKRLLWPSHNVFHLGLTKDGHPKHPLYLPATTKPERLT